MCVGFAALWSYDARPAHAQTPPARAPQAATATLLVFAHPKCPCTRATMTELAKLMARCGERLRATVVFVSPAGATTDWVEGDLWRDAAAIPGVAVRRDRGGAWARRLHAKVSGEAILYGADGRLLFTGGLTGSRGHEGDNDGEDAVAALVLTGTSPRSGSPVFGCALENESVLRKEQ
ncbi:hypothetical protein CCAX7_11290 [Capsulimonas corticalis]|uniref:Uncharacterized protein n=1 Tax=Capsulimonas corticalis TaxID=2219043 RepID=A0A402CUR1_9BACT|nr:hypothetical protein CCAX7_11290 [Capsulimonas corticalis]